jgi:excisionase family DNA binding protein
MDRDLHARLDQKSKGQAIGRIVAVLLDPCFDNESIKALAVRLERERDAPDRQKLGRALMFQKSGMSRPLMDYGKVAELLSVSIRTCRRWVGDGTLPAPDIKRGAVVRWRVETIEKWVARQATRKGKGCM